MFQLLSADISQKQKQQRYALWGKHGSSIDVKDAENELGYYYLSSSSVNKYIPTPAMVIFEKLNKIFHLYLLSI